MSLAEELKMLERQRALEIRTLHQTYLRTKRTVIRAASPERIMRKHIGVSLAVAALLGIAIAPRPSAPVVTKESEEKAPHSRWGLGALLARFKPAIHQVAPQVAAFIPNEAEHQQAAAAAPPPAEKSKGWHRIFRTLLVEGATLLLSKIDFMALLEQFLHSATPQNSAHSATEAPAGDPEPHVDPANAVTPPG